MEVLGPYLVIIGVAYFIPAGIAAARGHHQKGAIIVLNVVLGWTFLGWVAALIWAFTSIQQPANKQTTDR